jgi:hypothetical protein
MRSLFAALVAAFFAYAAAPAAAQQQNFTLVNATGYTINELYIGPVTSNRWGRDVLGTGVLPSGRQTPITFAPGQSECRWDIKVVYADGDESELRNVDLCRISVIRLTWDHANNRTVFSGQ